MEAQNCVVHLISSTRLDRGGPSISSTQLLESHRHEGLDGVLVCPDHHVDRSKYAEVSTAVYSDLEELFLHKSIGCIRAFHLHGIWDLFLHRAAVTARRMKIPYVVSPRGMLEPWALKQKKWKKRLAWYLYQRKDLKLAAFLHATASSEANQFNRLGLRNPVAVIPNGVTVPEDLRVRAAEKIVLFLSRVHPKKGLMMLADAWAKIQPSGWRMLVVGPDEQGHRQLVRARVDELGIGDSWEFRDAVYGEEKGQLFQQCSLFVLPTHSENFGIAIAEALAHGLPVITTNQAPWEGLVGHGCGWWVSADIGGIAQALRQATNLNLDELQEMGGRARRWMHDEFAWSSVAKRLINAYDKYIPAP